MEKKLKELLKRWNAEVIKWEAIARANQSDDGVRERSDARACAIANCRRELKKVLDIKDFLKVLNSKAKVG